MTPETDFGFIVTTAMKLKDKMVKKNLRVAKTPCPFCLKLDPPREGWLFGQLYPNKRFSHGKALHMRCDTCKTVMME